MANTRSSALPTTQNVKGLLGTKLGMTQVWDEQNNLVPVTVVATGNNVVTQIRNEETDGYPAVQIAFGEIDPRKVNKPTAGHFEKAGVTPRRHLVELRSADRVLGARSAQGPQAACGPLRDGRRAPAPAPRGAAHRRRC